MSFDDGSPNAAARLRALSHPLRLRILETLQTDGPMTATQLAGRLGSSPSNCSFHLRVLARASLITEAPGASGRNRPWALVEQTIDVDVDSLDDEGRMALRHAIVAGADRMRRNALDWLRRRDDYPPAWRAAAGGRELVVRLSADELMAFTNGVDALLAPYLDRDRRDTGSDQSVAITLSAFPLGPSPPDDASSPAG